MKDRGGEDQLIMFLSGMGGNGKSEVIKAFVEFVKGISIFLIGIMMIISLKFQHTQVQLLVKYQMEKHYTVQLDCWVLISYLKKRLIHGNQHIC